MNGTIAITDYGWYQCLRSQRHLEEVNFWRPSPRQTFRAFPYSPFLFKLKAPHNAICGFGYFARYARLEDWLAWDCFGIANGCRSFRELRDRLSTIRKRSGIQGGPSRTQIGCILIVEPTFFDEADWIPQPTNWPRQTQTSKTYDLTQGEGKRVWEQCLIQAPQALQPTSSVAPQEQFSLLEPTPRYGAPTQVRPRLGQGTFRVSVSEAYAWGCAITGEHSRPALDAAHIKPYGESGPHAVENGLLLRADVHRLFDRGYITVTPDLNVEVSQRLREDYQNGKSYYPLHGKSIHLPQQQTEQPSLEFLEWHNEQRYLG